MSSLGQSVEVRTIWALEISNKPEEPEPSEPKIRFVAGIHGNAPVGTELLLEFAAFLCINYGKNPYITRVSSGASSGKIVCLLLSACSAFIQLVFISNKYLHFICNECLSGKTVKVRKINNKLVLHIFNLNHCDYISKG